MLQRRPLTEVFPGIESTSVTILRAYDREIGTSLDPVEVLVLSAIVKFIGAKHILEIGTFDGNSALNLAANCGPDGQVVTVDLPADFGEDELLLNVSAIDFNATESAKTGRQFIGTEYSSRIKQVLEDSAKLEWSSLPGRPFDLIFIDGCHTYEYVKSDTEKAITNLKPGGVLVWHDYGMMPEVSNAVDEIAHTRTIKISAIQGTRLAVGFLLNS